MSNNSLIRALSIISSILFFAFVISSCSTKKNTAATRLYHSVNTRYNIHYNAKIAYDDALALKEQNREDNLSELLHIFPLNPDSASAGVFSGSFTTTIDKTTKAIKLHSITARPERNPNKRNDLKYQAWLRQKEYTPFMDQVWLLLAKSEFQEANYLRAITTFLYITKIYSSNAEIVAECQLWIARAYTEMGWMYEAGNILHKMELAGGPPDKLSGLYSLIKANYLVYSSEYNEALPHLELAIKNEKQKLPKIRMKYLLGQLYANTGDMLKADKAFESVQGMSTPYKYTFNAKLQQIRLDDSPNKEKALTSLLKMTKSSKNKDYLDQLYYAIGDIYLNRQDTAKAILNYNEAVAESVREGYDKAMAQVRLGDIYFAQRDFVPAQPNYGGALGLIKKSHTDYPRVALRSAVLDELVVHIKVVQEQDSLQYLAQLPEEERLAIIYKKIDDLKKEEEERLNQEDTQRRFEEREQRISSWGDITSDPLFDTPTSADTPMNPTFSGQSDGSFYFYNKQAVEQGKIAFKRQWGTRKLEDDWRRREKAAFSSGFDEPALDEDVFAEDSAIGEGMDNEIEGEVPLQDLDIYSVEYYLQQLPLTPEAIQASNILIENALFNMGLIYKDKLDDPLLAIDAFITDIKRFPSTPNLEEIYYQLFLIYMRMGNSGQMETYRARLLTEFPSGKYALPLSQPDYEWNFKYMETLQDSLYNEAYDAYKRVDVNTVRNNYQAMNTKYPFTDLMPNFTLLNALTYAQTRDAGNLEGSLSDLVTKYPKSAVTPLATDILKQLKEGRILLSDGTPVMDFDWSKAYLSDSLAQEGEIRVIQYSDTLDSSYILMLMFKPATIDRNQLLYQVADYNFSNYVIQTYDLSFDTDPPYDVLQIKGFKSFSTIKSYLNRGFMEGGLMQQLDSEILAVPISIDNYVNILPRLGLDNYMAYFSENFREQFPQLIARWEGVEYEGPLPDDAGQETEDELTDKDIVDESDTVIPDVEAEKPVVTEVTEQEKPKQAADEKQITADDLLTDDQRKVVEDVGGAVEKAEDILNNPVEGLKNLFKKDPYKENLTKEEKDALKQEEKERKKREKELKAIEKARQDSIRKVEKEEADAIRRIEKARQDSINTAQKQQQLQERLEREQKEQKAKDAVKARENARKQKEAERKDKEREQKERLREREKEMKERAKAREKERREKEKQARQERERREKEAEQRRKQKMHGQD